MVEIRSGKLGVKSEDGVRNGLSVEAIDDWLENDLIQRGILGDSHNTNTSSPGVQSVSDMASESSHHSSCTSSSAVPSKKTKRPGTTKDLASKRQRNTDAARRSRLRKALRLQSLELEVKQLMEKNDALAGQVATFEAQQIESVKREQVLNIRIRQLEAQLHEAQQQQLNQALPTGGNVI
ncbi:hypothetical protein NQZ79_g5885 [Umbelopsis isabellina]|nr:hypothetical protein NQZ79_g5885 [Umbelopsis isabellina]